MYFIYSSLRFRSEDNVAIVGYSTLDTWQGVERLSREETLIFGP